MRIREVGPRDGIQSEPTEIATRDKIELIDALSRTGLRFIEAVSFVSPNAVPQMADAKAVWAGIKRVPDVFYSALVPNQKGAEIAVAEGLDGLQVFTSVTDGYNIRNVGKTVEESFDDVAAVVAVGRDAGIPVEGTLSCAFGDPYDGDVDPTRVAELSERMQGLGVSAISYGDTTGMATPARVAAVVDIVRDRVAGIDINMHFHDTRGTGLANVIAALDAGVDYLDASIGGMGGSPFATGATGNIATEDLVHMLEDMGISTGIDLALLLDAGRLAQSFVGELPSKVLRNGPRDQLKEAG